MERLGLKNQSASVWVIVGALAGVWEMVAWSDLFPREVFPTIEIILIKLFTSKEILVSIIFSLGQVILALGISLAAVLMMLMLCRVIPRAGGLFEAMYTLLSPIPSVAILPLVILWFGLSMKGVVFLMVHATLWPLWTQLKMNQDRLAARFYRLERAYPVSLGARLYFIYLYGAMPDLLIGVQNAFNRGWRAIISIEMIFGLVGPRTGIGWYLYERRMMMDTISVYAGVMGIMICGILVDAVVFKRLRRGLNKRWEIETDAIRG